MPAQLSAPLLARIFPALFAVCVAVTFVSLHLQPADEEHFLMEKDQMVMFHDAWVGSPRGNTVGGTHLQTLPTLQWFYTLFFRLSTDLGVLLWVLLAFELAAVLALYFLVKKWLPPFSAELLVLFVLLDSPNHYDYPVLFLPNSHSQPFVIGLAILLVLFVVHQRFLYWHLANILLCLVVNLHPLNVVLLSWPVVVGLYQRRRFSRRQLLATAVPYFVLGLLFLPQVSALGSVLHPHLESGATLSQVVQVGFGFFSERSGLSFIGFLGVLVAAHMTFNWPRDQEPWLRAIAVLVVASALAYLCAFILAGEILVSEIGYRCRALVPGIVLTHFLALHAVVRWPLRRKHRRALLLAAVVALPVLVSVSWQSEARSSEAIYRVDAGKRLAANLVAQHGVSVEMLRDTVQVLPMHEQLLFLLESTSAAPAAGARRPEVDSHLVVQFLDRDLSFHPLFIAPCFGHRRLAAEGSAEVECAAAPARYIYVIEEAQDSPRLELDGELVPLIRAPEITFILWNGATVYRTVEPVELAGRHRLSLSLAAQPRSVVFESPELLFDHIPVVL